VIKPADPERFLSMIRDVLLEHRSGQLPAPAQPLEKEEVLLKSYNRRLVQKLEKKVRELEELRRDLDQRVQQRTAELLAANKELETFTSAVSHDLRSPLRAIAGHAQILALRSGDQLPPQSKSSLEALQSGVCRMDCLIEALLQLSRAGRAELHREQVNLSQMAIEIEGELRRENPSRDVQFTVAPDLHAQGDPILLRTLLRNLLANAWKFTAKSPEARVEFGLKQQNGQRAFFVHDNGAGFNMEAAGKLFAPFQRLHPSSEFPGTGIGLATVQQIVCRHGGSIRAEGAVNQGATFQFTLP
jgi:signal transduction histidine kinase